MRVPRGKLYAAKLTGKIGDVADAMRSGNYLHVPVLDEEGVVVGVFNEAAIFDYFCSDEIIDVGRDKPVKDTGSARAKLRCDLGNRQCPVVARSGSAAGVLRLPLVRAKQTSQTWLPTSVVDPERTSEFCRTCL
jgi:CBS domain-containing protein